MSALQTRVRPLSSLRLRLLDTTTSVLTRGFLSLITEERAAITRPSRSLPDMSLRRSLRKSTRRETKEDIVPTFGERVGGLGLQGKRYFEGFAFYGNFERKSAYEHFSGCVGENSARLEETRTVELN